MRTPVLLVDLIATFGSRREGGQLGACASTLSLSSIRCDGTSRLTFVNGAEQRGTVSGVTNGAIVTTSRVQQIGC